MRDHPAHAQIDRQVSLGSTCRALGLLVKFLQCTKVNRRFLKEIDVRPLPFPRCILSAECLVRYNFDMVRIDDHMQDVETRHMHVIFED